MNNLFDRPLRFFITYSLLIFILSIPFYYYMVDAIWCAELDENNEIIAKRAQYQLEHIDYTINNADSLILFWNTIQPNARIETWVEGTITKKDSIYSIYKAYAYSDYRDLDRFRVLETQIKINNKPYILIIESNIEEVYEIILGLAFLTMIFFITLAFGFVYYSHRMTKELWIPFKKTLENLKGFNLEDGKSIDLPSSNIIEFEELNEAVSKLTNKNLEVYTIQKEFTENASHELQTPLAIIQAKLDLVSQVETLDKNQYRLIEDAQLALLRAIRINKNLLLLAKIENRQFTEKESVILDFEVSEILELLDYEIKRKELKLHCNIVKEANVYCNKFLFTSLIQNLITNAIRYTHKEGVVTISGNSEGLRFQNSGREELNEHLIFKKFAKLDENNPGVGIGLSIVKGICDHNKWKIHYSFEMETHTLNITF